MSDNFWWQRVTFVLQYFHIELFKKRGLHTRHLLHGCFSISPKWGYRCTCAAHKGMRDCFLTDCRVLCNPFVLQSQLYPCFLGAVSMQKMIVTSNGLQDLTSLAFAFVFVNIFCWSDGSSFYQQILTWRDKEKKILKSKTFSNLLTFHPCGNDQ